MAARMPGPRRRTLEPIPDALIKETLPPDTKAAHVDAMRRLLHVAMTRARRRLVLAYPATTERGAVQPPSPFAEEARAALGAEWEAREEELFGPAETLQSTFRLLRDELLTTVQQVGGPARRAALRHRPRRLARGRALPRGAQALRADGAHPRRRADRRGGAARGQRAAAAGRDGRAARHLRDLGARRVPARRRARRGAAGAGGRPARRAVARAVPPQARRRARAVGERHRDLPDLPAQVQVRARVPDPVGADAQPALRDPRPPGARALPRRRRGDRLAARAARAARGRLAARRLRRLRGGAPAARQGDGRRCCATTSASRTRTPSRSGSSARSRSGWARTCCAGGSTASTSCPAAATS